MDTRIPGLASAADMYKNVSNMFMLGFNPKSTFSKGFNGLPLHGAGLGGVSVGGLLTTGGLAAGGAAVGAAIGSQMEGDMIGPAAAVGAVAGLTALPAAGLAARAGWEVGKRAVTGIGDMALKAPAVAGSAFRGAMHVAKSPMVAGIGKAAAGFASMMVDWDNMKAGKDFLESVKLTNPISGMKAGAKAGWASGKSLPGKILKGGSQGLLGGLINGQTILWGSSLIAGAAGAFNESNRIRMGQMDGMVTRSTPRVPIYNDNAGATGDLVFALNANRRG